MKKIIFDTDVLIDILRSNKKTLEQVRKLAQEYQEFCCSTVTIGELFAGMLPQEEGNTRNLLNGLSKFNVDENTAELAGRMKFKIKSHNLSLDDCLIAATVVINEGILVTKNVKHYPFSNFAVIQVT